MGLTLEQKSYLKSIDSKKKQKKQKKVFQIENFSKGFFNFLEKENKNRECKNDFGEFFNHKTNSTLTKDILNDLTQPKENINNDIIDSLLNDILKDLPKPFLDIQKSMEYAKKEAENKRFTLEDMKNAFNFARQMKAGEKINASEYKAVYYYDDFNHFMTDL